MVRKDRKRITYVLPLAKSAGGHRLGVNGLAVDPSNSVLYSGGRDGVICAWDLNLNLDPFSDTASSTYTDGRSSTADGGEAAKKAGPRTVFRQQVQAHTHWVNDIALVDNQNALVSASSDITVKLWRPGAYAQQPPQTIGLHSDYVKCLASPGPQASWVVSGGLDRKIALWDLQGLGERLQIQAGEEGTTEKGSVYALAATPNVIAAGGPESIVKVFDPRTGNRVAKFVGHTDNIRSVLIAEDGETIMTASSDQTVKVWSMVAGRCMYTLTMHNDSVWSLWSDHPRLAVFYSSDRSGLIAKTDCRSSFEMDEGLSVAVAKEHEGVNKVVQAGDYLWTSTSSSSINRWLDVDTEGDAQLLDTWRVRGHRASIATTRTRGSLSVPSFQAMERRGSQLGTIPMKSLLRLSNAAPFHMYSNRDPDDSGSLQKDAESVVELGIGAGVPVRTLPDHTIEGQNGLIKHHMLNDRRRVLTVDTAGDVVLWDLLQCRPVRSFGKRHLEDVLPEVNTIESVAHWCAVDTRTGSLTCVLEENHCFDAEMYADELHLDEQIEFREDQRINLGKWILRYLFANLIDEEIKRDELLRKYLIAGPAQARPIDVPQGNLQASPTNYRNWGDGMPTPTLANTPRALNGNYLRPTTPGMAIGLASPVPPGQTAGEGEPPLPSSAVAGIGFTTLPSSTERQGDYFSATPVPALNPTTPGGTVTEHAEPSTPTSPSEPTKKKGAFGKKFGMNMSFGMKKLGRNNTTDTPKAGAEKTVEEKSEDSDSRSSTTEHKALEESFQGTLQRIRQGYEDYIHEFRDRDPTTVISQLNSTISPSLPNETPVLKPPASTTILIQEDRPTAGGVADLFEGTVGTLHASADLIEKVAPNWLADVLLRNTIPQKEIVKVAFILEPMQGSGLPVVASDGNNRLNANRMLRARKVLAYIAERIEPRDAKEAAGLRPEEYLELWCQDKLLPPSMTLATIRAHVWRGGGDVLLYYKANGRREIRRTPLPMPGSPYYGQYAPPPASSLGTASDSGRSQTSSH